jgi:hypothetical protein
VSSESAKAIDVIDVLSEEVFVPAFAARECVVVDAGRIEPVSTSNSLLSGKRTGNFAETGLPRGCFAPNRLPNSVAYNEIPYGTEQGIIWCEQGNFLQRTGSFHTYVKEPRNRASTHHVPKATFPIVRMGNGSAQGLDLSRARRPRAWQLPCRAPDAHRAQIDVTETVTQVRNDWR